MRVYLINPANSKVEAVLDAVDVADVRTQAAAWVKTNMKTVIAAQALRILRPVVNVQPVAIDDQVA